MKVFQRFSRGERAPVRKSSSLNHPRYRGQRGASAIEYAIILAVITVVIIGVLQTDSFTSGISGLATDIGSLFSSDD
ncbi:Flp family type IVb pilin [Halomonas sp. EF61]|uniref:Flp family type IVb pilin n=1 Tax=Halomonas sp. EF61 TaxID=2950869 RepID=UPI0032DFD753